MTTKQNKWRIKQKTQLKLIFKQMTFHLSAFYCSLFSTPSFLSLAFGVLLLQKANLPILSPILWLADRYEELRPFLWIQSNWHHKNLYQAHSTKQKSEPFEWNTHVAKVEWRKKTVYLGIVQKLWNYLPRAKSAFVCENSTHFRRDYLYQNETYFSHLTINVN